jgi:hypothetical protein
MTVPAVGDGRGEAAFSPSEKTVNMMGETRPAGQAVWPSRADVRPRFQRRHSIGFT